MQNGMSTMPSIAATPEYFPLTPGQQTMVEGYAGESSRGIHFQQLVMETTESICPDTLRAAWAEMVQRHLALRLRVTSDTEGKFCQQFVEALPLTWRVSDWTEKSAELLSEDWRILLRQDRAAGFDLACAPLLRWHVLRLPKSRWRLLFSFHHVLLDGRSLPPLLREWRSIYEAFGQARIPPASASPTLPAYLDWHRRWRARSATEAENYWREQLKGFRGAKPVPPERVEADATVELDGGVARLWFDLDETETLRRAAATVDVTLFTLVQAAWALVLGAHARTEDLVLGNVRAARYVPLEGAVNMLGMFANTLPVRARLTGGTTVRSFLVDLRHQAINARPFEHAPPAIVHGASEAPSSQALYTSVTVFERFNLPELLRELPGFQDWTFELIERPPMPLTLAAQDGKRLAIQIVPDGKQYGHATAARLARQFGVALRELSRKLEARLEELNLLGPEEHHELVHARNQTDCPAPSNCLLHQWFEKQARLVPTSVAVVEKARSVTYRELDELANRFARVLLARGTAQEDIVAVCLDRGISLLVALLGILKAGAAYLPLAANLPSERLQMMIREARPKLMVHDSANKKSPMETGLACLNIDHIEAVPLPGNCPLPDTVSPDQLAYAIFTSGSTGIPKLVGIEHRNITNLLAFATEQLFQPSDMRCVPFVDMISFDSSIHQIFVPLALGGKLVVLRDASDLTTAAAAHPFSYLGTTPVSLQVLLDERLLPESIRCLGLGGEAIPESLVARLASLKHVERIFNFYGPTEATIYCTCARLLDKSVYTPGPCSVNTSVAGRVIGRPIQNTKVYVVDQKGRLAPDGVPGELWVAGAGVARGYLNSMPSGDENFGLDHFQPGKQRLYRTGDLVRYRVDGQLEFIGRIDDQLKLNGIRVEPSEIECVLDRHPAILRAALMARETPGSNKALVAYLVLRNRELLSVRSVQAHLLRSLPSNFVPAQFFVIDQLPMTPSGKIDRRALSQCTGQSLKAEFEFVAPRDRTELVLASLWQSLLNLETVSVKDDFFALGGNSLMAARLTSKTMSLLGQQVPFQVLYKAPTIEMLASWLKSNSPHTGPVSLVPLQLAGKKPPFFFLHGWGGGVRGFEGLARGLGPDQPVYGLMAAGLDGTRPRHIAVEEMAVHYAKEIRGCQPEGPYYLGGYSTGGWIAFAVALELQRQGQSIGMLALIDTSLFNCKLPRTIHLRWTAGHISGRLGHHARKFLRVSNGERLRYVAGRWKALKFIMRGSYRKEISLKIPDPLLVPDQVGQGSDYYCDLVKRFRPECYEGSIDYFCSEGAKASILSSWNHFASRGVLVHPLPGRHLKLLESSVLPDLTIVFRTILNRAQEDHLRMQKQERRRL
jgi:amino acid adenylation domain-containing protein